MGFDFIREVVPWIGNVFSLGLYLTPMELVLRMKRTGEVGVINPLPFVMQFLQGQVWAIYGFFITNVTLVPVNMVGLTAGLYGLLVFHGACKHARTKARIEVGLAACAFCPVLLCAILVFGVSDNDTRSFVFGIGTNVVSIAFFGSPLSTLLQILRTRNAASIHWPTSLAVVCNGVSWTTYGLWIANDFIWIPNGLAGLLAVAQLLVRFTVGVKPGAGTVTRDSPAANGAVADADADADDGQALARTVGGSIDTTPFAPNAGRADSADPPRRDDTNAYGAV